MHAEVDDAKRRCDQSLVVGTARTTKAAMDKMASSPVHPESLITAPPPGFLRAEVDARRTEMTRADKDARQLGRMAGRDA